MHSVQSSVRVHLEQDMSTGSMRWAVVPAAAHTCTELVADDPAVRGGAQTDDEGSVGSTAW